MNKLFALLLVSIVLLISVCVFVPNDMALAATKDSYHWVSSAYAGSVLELYPSDAPSVKVSIPVSQIEFVTTSSGVVFFSLSSLVEKFVQSYPVSSYSMFILRLSLGRIAYSVVGGDTLDWAVYCSNVVSNTIWVDFSYSYSTIKGDSSNSSWTAGQIVYPAAAHSLTVSSDRLLSSARFRFHFPSASLSDLQYFDSIWIAFGYGSSTRNVTALALTDIQKYFDDNTIDTSSDSYNAGYDKGKTDVLADLANDVLTSSEYVEYASLDAYSAAGTKLAHVGAVVDFDFMYNGEKFLRLYNFDKGIADVDHYLVTIKFSYGVSFVPVSLRSTTGYVSAGNDTAPLVPASSFGALFGSDFDQVGSSTTFLVWLDSQADSVTLRLLGNSYGNTLDSIYETGLNAGISRGEKIGYEKGFSAGVLNSGQYSFFNLVASVIDVPINAILSLFDLEIFGVNLAPLMTALLSICVVITIIKMIL